MHIRVYGIPAPQGSKVARPVYAGSGADRHFTGRVNQVESAGEKLTSWREAIRNDCAQQRQGRTFADGPVSVIAQFYLPRPRAHFGSGGNSGRVKASSPAFPVGKKDDLDKLTRAVLDGLTEGGAFGDDGQVACMMLVKLYADATGPGCELWISRTGPFTGLTPDATEGDNDQRFVF